MLCQLRRLLHCPNGHVSIQKSCWDHVQVLTPLFNNSIPILLHIVLSLATAPFLSVVDTGGKALVNELAKSATSRPQW
jgi:hypothetical protein